MLQPGRQPLSTIAISLRDALKATFSPVINRLWQLISNPDPEPKAIVEVLKLDPALATSVLALANSPYCGQSIPVTSLKRAVLVIGHAEILRMALSLSLQKSLSTVLEKHGFDVFANWRAIIWSALGAEEVAERLCPNEKNAAYICALVKDLSLLLYAATYPDELRAALKYPDFVRSGATSLAWIDSGQQHENLTAELLRGWNFPETMITTIANHHDLENLSLHPPLTQAVILGTRWAEVEFRDDPTPDALGQFSSLMTKVLSLSLDEMEKLRARCSQCFSDLCAALGIVEQRFEDRLYTLSLQDFQDFHYQAREIEGLSGGREAIAGRVARHLHWNWNCSRAEIILFCPEASLFARYLLVDGKITASSQAISIERFANLGDLTVPLRAKDSILGELRLLMPMIQPTYQAEVVLYARLLAHSYEYYLQNIHALEAKAELLDILPAGVALLTESGRIIRANLRFEAYLHEKNLAGQLLGEVLKRTAYFSEVSQWCKYLDDKTQASHCLVACDLGPGDQERRPSLALCSYKLNSPVQTNILVIIQDLANVQALESEVLRQRDFLNHVLTSMQDLVMTTDAVGTITYASGEHARYLHGKNIFHITTPTAACFADWSMNALENSQEAVEVQLTVDGSSLPLELLFSKFSSGPDHGVIVGRDLSSIRRLERKIKEQALFDSLTQVFNRHHLDPILEREMARAQRTATPLGMIFLDIDKFKQFNDTYGHVCGDQALRDLGQIIRSMLRKSCDYPCRYGGDEFVIISGNAGQDILMNIARRIQEQYCRRYPGQTLSIGLTVLEPGDTAKSLLERADLANYQAKSRGGNAIAQVQADIVSEA